MEPNIRRVKKIARKADGDSQAAVKEIKILAKLLHSSYEDTVPTARLNLDGEDIVQAKIDRYDTRSNNPSPYIRYCGYKIPCL